MPRLTRNIRHVVKQSNTLQGKVIDTSGGRASVRVSGTGAKYSNLEVVGGSVAVGDWVSIDFSTSIPKILSSNNEPAATKAARPVPRRSMPKPTASHYAQALFYLPAGDGLTLTSPYKIYMFLPAAGGAIQEIKVRANTAPSTTALRVTVSKNGSNILASPYYIELTTGNTVVTHTDFADSLVGSGDLMEVAITQLDSTVKDIVVSVRYTY